MSDWFIPITDDLELYDLGGIQGQGTLYTLSSEVAREDPPVLVDQYGVPLTNPIKPRMGFV